MSAMAWTGGPDLEGAAPLFKRLHARFGPIAAVVAVHALLFYLISSGLLARVAEVALPQVVDVTFVASEPEPPAPTPPAIPKTVTLAQLPPPVAVPVPVIEVARTPDAITLPAPAPATAPAAQPRIAVASAPAPAPQSGPKTISSGVEYIQPPQPVYPSQSRRMGEQGKVVLRVLVNEQGKPDQVLVQHSSGSSRLDEAGRQAALRALFKPHLEDGRPVAVFVIVPLNFQLG